MLWDRIDCLGDRAVQPIPVKPLVYSTEVFRLLGQDPLQIFVHALAIASTHMCTATRNDVPSPLPYNPALNSICQALTLSIYVGELCTAKQLRVPENSQLVCVSEEVQDNPSLSSSKLVTFSQLHISMDLITSGRLWRTGTTRYTPTWCPGQAVGNVRRVSLSCHHL